MSRIRRNIAILWLAAGLAGSAVAQTFAAIDYPGAAATQAMAINARGEILGNWQDDAGNWHAYVRTGGRFVGFDCQGAVATRLNGINSKEEAVGTLKDASGKWRGYYLHMALPGSWEPAGAKCVIVEPQASTGKTSNTGAFGISEDGEIAGEFEDSDGKIHGVLTRGGVHFIFDVAEGPWNGGLTFTRQGDLVGHVQTGGRMKGWSLSRDGLQTIEFPPGEDNAMTCPFGVNSLGEIVGHYMRKGDQTRGFLFRNGTYVSIDIPDAKMTDARAISNDGVIAGFYTDSSSKTHGFVMRR